MIHEMPFASDGVYTEDLLIDTINSNLANVLGNLVNRTIGMVNKYFDGKITNTLVYEDIDKDLIDYATSLKENVTSLVDNLELSNAIDKIFDLFRKCNKYIDDTTPWILAKDESKKERLACILYNLLECIRIGSVLLQAFLPTTAEKIFKQINTKETSFDSLNEFGKYESPNTVNPPEVLFARIEK